MRNTNFKPEISRTELLQSRILFPLLIWNFEKCFKINFQVLCFICSHWFSVDKDASFPLVCDEKLSAVSEFDRSLSPWYLPGWTFQLEIDVNRRRLCRPAKSNLEGENSNNAKYHGKLQKWKRQLFLQLVAEKSYSKTLLNNKKTY